MYARLAVASNAVQTDGLPVAAANLVHASLLEQVNAHGRLIFADDPEIHALLRAIKSDEGIPPDARKRWIETLVRMRQLGRIQILHRSGALADVRDLVQLRADWGLCADVAVVASEACAALGVPDGGLLTTPGILPDVAITAAATDSPVIQRLKALAETGVAVTGSLRDDFWHEVLEPLATDARSVTILDGYLFKPTWDIEAGRPWTRAWNGEQLAWLLERLDACMASDAEVLLLGCAHRDYPAASADSTADAIRDLWRPTKVGRLHSVRVALGDPKHGERFPHDRHIRFSTGGAIDLNAGLDRLRDDAIWDPDGMKWRYIWHASALSALRNAETRAETLVRSATGVVLERL